MKEEIHHNNDRRIELTSEGRIFLRETRYNLGFPTNTNIHPSTVVKWENGTNKPTIKFLIRYISYFNLDSSIFLGKFTKTILEPISAIGWKGSKKFDKLMEEEICRDYLSLNSIEKVGQKYNCNPVTVWNILHRHRVNTTKIGTNKNYKFPATQFGKLLIDNDVEKEYMKPLIISLLLTDGSAHKQKPNRWCITFSTKDETLNNIFADIVFYGFGIIPSSYMIRAGRTKAINYQGSKAQFIDELLQFSPTFKTKPNRNESWDDMLSYEIQPTISFLKNCDKWVRNTSIRLAMCADGSIGVSNRREKGTMFILNLGCAHPVLVKEWKKVFFKSNIKMNIIYGKSTRTGISGIKSIRDALFRFNEIDGFMKGVKVVKNSNFKGIEKQRILEIAVEMLKKYRTICTVPLPYEKVSSMIKLQ